MSRLLKLFIALVVLSLLTGSAVLAQDAAPRPYRIVVVTHGQASDPFWSVVKNGVDQAATDMRVTVEYQAPATFDMVAMSQLIDAAVASNPDGLVVSIPDADALGPSIQAAIAAGIPVISINSGSDVAADPRRAGAHRSDGIRSWLRRRSAHGGSGREECPLRQSGSRQRGARSALPGLHRRDGGSGRQGDGAGGRSGRPDRCSRTAFRRH